jgi:phage terminase large subunit-like protein
MKDFKKIVEKYINDVLNNKIVVGELVRLTVQRHVDDLKRKDIFFDENSAIRYLNFVHRCKHVKGELASKGKTVEFEPQQNFRYWCVMGWKRLDGNRRFNKIYFEVARKNGKSLEGAILNVYGLIADGEFGSEIYSVATRKDQAKIVYEMSKQILKKLKQDSPKIDQLVKINLANCSVIDTNSRMEPLASNSEKQDGTSPHFAVVDEYHAHKNSDLLEIVETGMGSRSQPLLVVITTAGFNKQSACYQLRKVAIDILKGVKKDDSFMACIFAMDDDDDWNDENNWIKSNPNIGITPRWQYMRDQYTKTKTEGIHKEIQFKTKNLNMWTDSSMAWINDKKWMNVGLDEFPDLNGRECFAGIDLASVSDMNAFVLVFPIDDKLFVKSWFWIPEATAQRKNEVGDYLKWCADGFISTSDGDVIDQNIILRDILLIVKDYKMKFFAFDRFIAYNTIVRGLVDNGFEGFEHGQGFLSMSEPTKELEKMVLSGTIHHDKNPVMRWQMGNVELSIDGADNIKPDKGKSTQKIDGVVALVMAINCWMKHKDDENTSGSPYDERGIIFI